MKYVLRNLKFESVKPFSPVKGRLFSPDVHIAAWGGGYYVMGPDGVTSQGICEGQYYLPSGDGFIVLTPDAFKALFQPSLRERLQIGEGFDFGPEWAEDQCISNITTHVDFMDRLRILFTGKIESTLRIYTEFAPGRVESDVTFWRAHPVFGWLRRFQKWQCGEVMQQGYFEPDAEEKE